MDRRILSMLDGVDSRITSPPNAWSAECYGGKEVWPLARKVHPPVLITRAVCRQREDTGHGKAKYEIGAVHHRRVMPELRPCFFTIDAPYILKRGGFQHGGRHKCHRDTGPARS